MKNILSRSLKKASKKAFTLLETLIVIIILTIVVLAFMPTYSRLKKSMEYKEASSLLELVRAGAKYYDVKYGIGHLVGGAGAWDTIKVERPTGGKLDYDIAAGPKLQIKKKDGTTLYVYDLPDGPGTPTADPDASYLPDDLP
jgi:prepilin-type N-terminal cleavage/methylation domain-containing protein